MLGLFSTPGTDSTSSTTSSTSTSSLSDQLNSLFNAFQSVVTDPTSTAQRQALVNQAQSLTARILQRSKIAPPSPATPSSN